MKNLVLFLAILILILLSTKIFTQENDFIRERFGYSVPEKIENPVANHLQAGTYSVGSFGSFPTLDSAFNKLAIDGIEGEVILQLVDDLYSIPENSLGFLLNGPISGAGPNSRVTIRPAYNKNVTIEGDGEGVLLFVNTSYVTLDGIGLTGNTTLRIHSYQNTSYIWNDGISFLNNSKHNVVQNVTVECDDYTRKGGGIVFLHESGNFMPDSNLIQNNFVKKAAMGICVTSFFYKATGNIIRGNLIGSENDSLISMGINLVLTQYSIVEDNIIQNLRNNSQLPYCPGITSVAGTAETIRNNVVHNVYVDNGNYGGMGILLNGTSSNSGIINSVYNNMVYDIRSSSPDAAAKVSGIELRNQSYAKIYFNSVYLSGTGTNQKGSASLYIGEGCSNNYVNNNILVNTRNEEPYCASAIYDFSFSNLTSDNNNLYYEPTQYNCLVSAAGTDYHSLSEWQSTGKDLQSINELPHFTEPYLHIDISFVTNLESGGKPIGGLVKDFDYQLRNTVTPDIGADEFDGIVSVAENEIILPNGIRLEQNYPNPFNPSTKIRFTIPVTLSEVEGSLVTLKVYDVLGNEVVTLVNEEKPAGSYEVEFNALSLPSGVYFYTIHAGSFVETKKMVLIK
jgi:hypothetical protein